ncbi:hypothetical protein F5Y15DRAFT_338292 [Xylariaceae sp. FL0016]|nr:hypothetical protein F5Y15DRAFT_338292 [Xylariaceae sp. FL0016]
MCMPSSMPCLACVPESASGFSLPQLSLVAKGAPALAQQPIVGFAVILRPMEMWEGHERQVSTIPSIWSFETRPTFSFRIWGKNLGFLIVCPCIEDCKQGESMEPFAHVPPERSSHIGVGCPGSSVPTTKNCCWHAMMQIPSLSASKPRVNDGPPFTTF